MLVRSISAIAAGTLIAFFWGFLSWTLLSWHQPKSFETPEGTTQAPLKHIIHEYAPEHGVYMMPGPVDGKNVSDKDIQRGPFIYAIIRPESRPDFTMKRAILGSALTSLMGAIALTAIMQMGAQRFMPRFFIGILAGFLTAISCAMPQLNWFELPTSHFIATFADGVITWSLAGLAIAAILSKKAKQKED